MNYLFSWLKQCGLSKKYSFNYYSDIHQYNFGYGTEEIFIFATNCKMKYRS
jgi:hypothetical protein